MKKCNRIKWRKTFFFPSLSLSLFSFLLFQNEFDGGEAVEYINVTKHCTHLHFTCNKQLQRAHNCLYLWVQWKRLANMRIILYVDDMCVSCWDKPVSSQETVLKTKTYHLTSWNVLKRRMSRKCLIHSVTQYPSSNPESLVAKGLSLKWLRICANASGFSVPLFSGGSTSEKRPPALLVGLSREGKAMFAHRCVMSVGEVSSLVCRRLVFFCVSVPEWRGR